MKRFSIFCLSFFFFLPLSSFANKADAFKGWYQIMSQSQSRKPIPKEYFLLDADSLQNLWHKYSSQDFPPDWNDLKEEPSILAAFTNRDFLILTLTKNALISDTFLQIAGGDRLLEMRRRPDGTFDMATKENQSVSRYLLAVPEPVTNLTNQLP